jgi:hypothetical protein
VCGLSIVWRVVGGQTIHDWVRALNGACCEYVVTYEPVYRFWLTFGAVMFLKNHLHAPFESDMSSAPSPNSKSQLLPNPLFKPLHQSRWSAV